MKSVSPIGSKTMTEKTFRGTTSRTRIKKLDIAERLNLAKKEAILERKMDQLNEDILNHSKQETIDKTMKFLKKLPGISGNDPKENLKRSFSTSTVGNTSFPTPSPVDNRNDRELFDESLLGKDVVGSDPISILILIPLLILLATINHLDCTT